MWYGKKRVRGAGVEPAWQIAGNSQGCCVYRFRQPLVLGDVETVGLEPTGRWMGSPRPAPAVPPEPEALGLPLVPLFYLPPPFTVLSYRSMTLKGVEREVDHAADRFPLRHRHRLFRNYGKFLGRFWLAVSQRGT